MINEKSSFKCLFLVSILLPFFLMACRYEKTTLDFGSLFEPTWDFSEPASLSFDQNYVEIKDGVIQLKPIELVSQGDNFQNGIFRGTTELTEKVSLIVNNSGVTDLDNILPTKNQFLSAYWKFDSDFMDSSTNNNDGTAVDSAHLTTGRIKNALIVDGTTDAVTVVDDDSLDGTNKLSMAFWFNSSGESTVFDAIISKRITSNNNQSYTLWYKDQNLILDLDGFGDRVTSNATLLPGLWHHVAFTYDGELPQAERVKLFINGELDQVATETSSTIPNYSSGLAIGRDSVGGSQSFIGLVDEFAIWKTVLTESEISSIFSTQSFLFSDQVDLSPYWAPRFQDLVGYWKMDGNWQDFSGKGNHGSSSGTPALVDGKVGSQAVDLDGTNESINLGSITSANPLSLASQSFTIMLWVNQSASAGSSERIIDKSTGTFGADGYSLALSASGELEAFTMGGSFSTPVGTVTTGAWHHITYVQTETKREFYLAGQLILAETGSYTLPNSVTANTRIGNWQTDNTRSFAGQLDEVAIWQGDLSAKEISLVYERQKQKYVGNYDSEVIDLGSEGAPWSDLSWWTDLPFGKELVGDTNNDGLPDSDDIISYPQMTYSLNLGLEAYWPLNETVADSAPGGKDFEDFSGNNVGCDLLLGNLGVKGKFGRGMHDARASCGNYLGFAGVSSFSASLWFKTDMVGAGFLDLIVKRGSNGDGSQGWLCYLQASTGIATCKRTIDGVELSGSSFGGLNDGEWHHLGFTYDGATRLTYIDGVEVGSVADSRPMLDLGVDLFLGGPPADVGHIDEVAIWSRALSLEEIKKLYRRGAHRVKFQVKSCVDANCECKGFNSSPVGTTNDCDGDAVANSIDNDDIYKADFIGPGGNATTFHSELLNRKGSDLNFNCGANTSDNNSNICVDDEIDFSASPRAGNPQVSYSDLPLAARPTNNRYFQYRAHLEADSNSFCTLSPCFPSLTSVSVDAEDVDKFYGIAQEVKPLKSIDYKILKLAKIDGDNCTSFQLSPDGTNYYYWGLSSWQLVSLPSHRSSKSEVEENISSFSSQLGPGTLFVKAFLETNSNQSSNCSLREIDIKFTN